MYVLKELRCCTYLIQLPDHTSFITIDVFKTYLCIDQIAFFMQRIYFLNNSALSKVGFVLSLTLVLIHSAHIVLKCKPHRSHEPS